MHHSSLSCTVASITGQHGNTEHAQRVKGLADGVKRLNFEIAALEHEYEYLCMELKRAQKRNMLAEHNVSSRAIP